MPGTREYKVTVNGYETTLLLSDADAKERGLYTEPKAAASKQAPAPKNKARTSSRAKATPKPATAPVEDKGDSGSAGDA